MFISSPLSADFSPDNIPEIFLARVRLGDSHSVKILLEFYQDKYPELVLSQSKNTGGTALHICVERNDTKTVRVLHDFCSQAQLWERLCGITDKAEHLPDEDAVKQASHQNARDKQLEELIEAFKDGDFKKLQSTMVPFEDFANQWPHKEQLKALRFLLLITYIKDKKHDKAAEQIGVLKKETLSRTEQCRLFLCEGDNAMRQKAYPGAIEGFEKAQKIYKSLSGAEKSETVSHIVMPLCSENIHQRMRKALAREKSETAAIDYLKEQQREAEAAQNNRLLLDCIIGLGNQYDSMGQYTEAGEVFSQAKELATRLDNKIALGNIVGNIGNIALKVGQNETAYTLLLQSLEMTVFHDPSSSGLSRCLVNFSLVCDKTGTQVVATDVEKNVYLALAEALCRYDPDGRCNISGSKGNLAIYNKRYEEAIQAYNETLQSSEEADRPDIARTARNNKGAAYYELAKSSFLFSPQEQKSSQIQITPALPNVDEDNPMQITTQGKEHLKHVKALFTEEYKSAEETLKTEASTDHFQWKNVSGLFDNNQRGFHLLQNALLMEGDWQQALVLAEQTRNRIFSEMLRHQHCRNMPQLPFDYAAIQSMVNRCGLPVVYISYTGDLLIFYGLAPNQQQDKTHASVIAVAMPEEGFMGRSFDYFCRYSIQDYLQHCIKSTITPAITGKRRQCCQEHQQCVALLNRYIAEPLQQLFNNLGYTFESKKTIKTIFIHDPYTQHIPFHCLSAGQRCVGTILQIQQYHSLAEMQYTFQQLTARNSPIIPDAKKPSLFIPQTPVTWMEKSSCIIGNPTIPQFVFQGNLQELPPDNNKNIETRTVAEMMSVPPVITEEAKKGTFIKKLTKSTVAHVATHGSFTPSYLAFKPETKPDAQVTDKYKAEDILVTAKDIISEDSQYYPALVALSPNRRADGYQKCDAVSSFPRAIRYNNPCGSVISEQYIDDVVTPCVYSLYYQLMRVADETQQTLTSLEAMHLAIAMLSLDPLLHHACRFNNFQHFGPEQWLKFSMEETASIKPEGFSDQYSIWSNRRKLSENADLLKVSRPDAEKVYNYIYIDSRTDAFDIVIPLITSHTFNRKLKAASGETTRILWLPANPFAVQACMSAIGKITGSCLLILDQTESFLHIEEIFKTNPMLCELSKQPETTLVLLSNRFHCEHDARAIKQYGNRDTTNTFGIPEEPHRYIFLNMLITLFQNQLFDQYQVSENEVLWSLVKNWCGSSSSAGHWVTLYLTLADNPEAVIESAKGLMIEIAHKYDQPDMKMKEREQLIMAWQGLDELSKKPSREELKRNLEVHKKNVDVVSPLKQAILVETVLDHMITRALSDAFKASNQSSNKQGLTKLFQGLSLIKRTPVPEVFIDQCVAVINDQLACNITRKIVLSCHLLKPYPACTEAKPKETCRYIPGPIRSNLLGMQSTEQLKDSVELIFLALERYVQEYIKEDVDINSRETRWIYTLLSTVGGDTSTDVQLVEHIKTSPSRGEIELIIQTVKTQLLQKLRCADESSCTIL